MNKADAKNERILNTDRYQAYNKTVNVIDPIIRAIVAITPHDGYIRLKSKGLKDICFELTGTKIDQSSQMISQELSGISDLLFEKYGIEYTKVKHKHNSVIHQFSRVWK